METAAAPLGTRQRQRVATRERLFRAALDEIRRAGVAAAQVDRVVAAAGVSRGSFYFHFPAREDVLLEWERRREADILAGLAAGAGDERPLRDALLEVVRFLVALVGSADAPLLLETLAIHVRRAVDPQDYPLLGEIERRFAAAIGRGELRRGLDARRAAVLFLSNLFGFLVMRTTSRRPYPSPELLVDVFLSGVSGAAPGAGGRAARRAPVRRKR